MKTVRERLISLMFLGIFVCGVIEILRLEAIHCAIGFGLLGSCGLLMKVNMVCNHYLMKNRNDDHE